MLDPQNIEKDLLSFSLIGSFLESELLKTTESYYKVRKEVDKRKESFGSRLNFVSFTIISSVSFLGLSFFLKGYALFVMGVVGTMLGMGFFSEMFNRNFFKSKTLQSIFSFLGKNKIDDFNLLKQQLTELANNLAENLKKPETRVCLAKLLNLYSEYPEHRTIKNGLTKIMRNYIENDFDGVLVNFVYILDDMKVHLKNDYEIKKYVSETINAPIKIEDKKSVEEKISDIYKKKPAYII